ncbi:MAG: glycogen/starch synthase, partial [Candidatus Omnitrophica bacterium]|nr:glycogen/starch synthase [Candidatus Omnitrophota bacterium]
DHDERVRLNRYVFDRVTERPEAFPPATFNYSAFDSTGYAVRIPFHKRPHQVRILWSVNGNPVQQSDALHPVTLNNSHLEYRWQVPVQEGWVHYAVQVQDRPGGRWRYLRSPSDSRDPRARANGLIKFQQDVRGRRVASIRPETFNLRLENLRPMVDSQGNILVGTLADLKAQLQSIKEQGYGEIYLQVLEPGAAGEAGPDESSFSPLDQIHISARIGGLKGLLELKKIADELDLEISLDMVPHLSRSNREVVPRMPVWIVEPETGRLVRRAASDGGLTEEWRDSFARNWADARNVQDYIAQLSELARLGFNFRVDVAHVFDTTFETDPETVGMARIAGQVVTENTEEVMFLGQRRRVFKTNDLRFTEEPNSVLAWIIYEVKKAGFEQGHQTKFYGENWHGHEARLIQSGIDFPFDPVLMNVWHMVREGYPSDECTQTLRYLTDIQQRFGGGTVTLQNNHDAQVAAVDAFGDSAFAAISTLAFVSGGVSFEHFHYAYPSWDGSIDWEQVAGDTGRVPTFNFGAPRVVHQRFWPGYSWEAKVRRTSDELDRNPYFRGLGGHLRRVTDLTRRYPPPPISLNVGHHRVVGVARRGGPDEFLIMLSHLGSSFAADINFHPNDERQDGHGLGEFDDNAVYEFAEVYNNENVSVDEDHPGDQMILTGREITHLGMGPRYPLPILGTRIYRFRKISDNIPQVRTPQYRALLEDSIQRYRRYGPRERFWHSFVTDEIIHALTLTEPQENMTVEQTRYAEFKKLFHLLVAIVLRNPQLDVGELNKVFGDIVKYSGEIDADVDLVEELHRFLINMAVDDQATHTDTSEVAIQVLRSADIGEIVISSPESLWSSPSGGLALQVSDIASELARMGVPVTVIVPLFGDQKKRIFDRIRPRDTGRTVTVRFNTDGSESQVIKIYEAREDGVRILYLENDAYFNKLKGRPGERSAYNGSDTDRLRFARMLSLGTLLAIREMNIHASVIQTNDWTTAYVKAYLEGREMIDANAQDLKNDSHLATARVLHLDHNLQLAYHGRCFIPDETVLEEMIRNDLGLDPERDLGILVQEDQPEFINPTYTANRTADHVRTVGEGYHDRSLLPQYDQEFGGLGSLLREREAAQTYDGVTNGIALVRRQRGFLHELLADAEVRQNMQAALDAVSADEDPAFVELIRKTLEDPHQVARSFLDMGHDDQRRRLARLVFDFVTPVQKARLQRAFILRKIPINIC